MDNPLSPIVADVYMSTLELDLFNNTPSSGSYMVKMRLGWRFGLCPRLFIPKQLDRE